MERDSYVRQLLQLRKTATRDPDPDTRRQASERAENLRKVYRRNQS